MNLALLGTTGRTGTHALTTALARGHQVAVLVREPDRLPVDVRERVRGVVGDATDSAALADLLAGAEAVVSALGPVREQPDLHTRTARALVEIMSGTGPRRFVGISGAGIDVPGDRKAPKDRVFSALIQRFGGDVVQDKAGELAVWATSDVDWTLVRPPRLVDGAATGAPLEHDAHRSTRSTRITRGDLGAFLIEVVEHGLYPRQAPFVATLRG